MMLIYPTVVSRCGDYGRSYGGPDRARIGSFVAFWRVLAAGRLLVDRWSRRSMMALFYIGAAFRWRRRICAEPDDAHVALSAVKGMSAAIYDDPVGTAMVLEAAVRRGPTMASQWRLAAISAPRLRPASSPALIAGLGWRGAFLTPAVVMLASGAIYLGAGARRSARNAAQRSAARTSPSSRARARCSPCSCWWR